MRTLSAVLAVAIIVPVACGDGGDPPLTDEEAAAIASVVDAELGLDEQRCVLQGLVDSGVEPTAILDDTLSVDQEGELLAAAVECVADLSEIEAFVDSFIEGAAESGTVLSREEARCAIRALDATDVDAEILECLGDRAGEADGYGEDTVLDLLWDQCGNGNSQACDELFRVAPIGSRYESYGRTCGDLLPESAGLLCFEELG